MREMRNACTVLMLGKLADKTHLWRNKRRLEDNKEGNQSFSPRQFL
jgi:hypothetical protein